MKKIILATAISVFAFSASAQAAGIKYFEDPVYQKMAPQDSLPMEDMLVLAEDGDVRAQYILGDLFSKGKGGFPRNVPKAIEWFETSARNGFAFSFIRLAAMAKKADRPVEAYQWYTLCVEHCTGDNRAWAQTARTALETDAKLTDGETKQARKNADKWEDEAIIKNRADREARKAKEDALIGPKKPVDKDNAVNRAIDTKKTTAPVTPPKEYQNKYRNGDN